MLKDKDLSCAWQISLSDPQATWQCFPQGETLAATLVYSVR